MTKEPCPVSMGMEANANGLTNEDFLLLPDDGNATN